MSIAFCSSPNCSKAFPLFPSAFINASLVGELFITESENLSIASGKKIFSGLLNFLSVVFKRSIIAWLGRSLRLQEKRKVHRNKISKKFIPAHSIRRGFKSSWGNKIDILQLGLMGSSLMLNIWTTLFQDSQK